MRIFSGNSNSLRTAEHFAVETRIKSCLLCHTSLIDHVSRRFLTRPAAHRLLFVQMGNCEKRYLTALKAAATSVGRLRGSAACSW